MAMILVTHDLGVLAGRTDRVAVMYAGRIVEMAPTRGLFDAPRHHYTRALMGSSPRMDQPSGVRLVAVPGAPPAATERPDGCAFHPRCDASQSDCESQQPALAVTDASGHSWSCHHPVDVT